MKEVVKWFNYEEFNPLTNHFDYKPYSATRPMTKDEQMISFCFDLTLWIDAISIIATIIASITIACIIEKPIGLLWILPIMVIGITICVLSSHWAGKLENKIDHFADWGFEIEELMYAQKQGSKMILQKHGAQNTPLKKQYAKPKVQKIAPTLQNLQENLQKF